MRSFLLALLITGITIITTGGLVPGTASAEHVNIKAEAAAIATGIEDRMPVGVGDTFSHDVTKLYCYSKITGAHPGDAIEHVWYWGDSEMARVELALDNSGWRTWSSKRIIRVWKGQWRVDIVAHGQVIESLPFTIGDEHSLPLGGN